MNTSLSEGNLVPRGEEHCSRGDGEYCTPT